MSMQNFRLRLPREECPREMRSKPNEEASLATTNMPFKDKPTKIVDIILKPYKLTTSTSTKQSTSILQSVIGEVTGSNFSYHSMSQDLALPLQNSTSSENQYHTLQRNLQLHWSARVTITTHSVETFNITGQPESVKRSEKGQAKVFYD